MIDQLSIVLLAYNEQQSVENDLINIYQNVAKKVSKYEIIVVEDFSKDNTYEILKKYEKKMNLKILRGENRLGYRNSLVYGIKNSKYNNIFFSEFGSKYNFKEFSNFAEGYTGENVFSGFRKPRYDNIDRKALTFLMNIFISILFLKKINDADSGYKLISKDKYMKYYVENCNFIDFGSAEMILRMHNNNEKIIEKKISYYQRPDESKQFNFFKIIKKSFILILRLISLRFETFKQ
jgi:glycosyltransferase involved in cell wall biosynthesis